MMPWEADFLDSLTPGDEIFGRTRLSPRASAGLGTGVRQLCALL